MDDALEVVTVEVGGEVFGLELSRVREVLPGERVQAASGGSERPPRVVEARGESIPVLDLGERLGLRATPGRSRLVVVTHPAAGPLALRVDGVGDVREIARPAIQPPPPLYSGVARRFVRGLAGAEGVLLVLLDLDALLSGSEAETFAAGRGEERP